MKRALSIVAAVVVALWLVSCASGAADGGSSQQVVEAPTEEVKKDNLSKLRGVQEQINKEKEASLLSYDYYEKNQDPAIDFQKYYNEGLPRVACRALQQIQPLKEKELKNNVETDVELMFAAFRYAMGAYNALGGDEVFDAAKERIIARIEALSGDEVSTEDAMNIMIEELAFVNDYFFSIGGYYPFKDYHAASMMHRSYTSGIYLEDSMLGYYERDDVNNRYRNAGDENSFTAYMIDKDGAICFTPVLYCTDAEFPGHTTASFKGETREIEWKSTESSCTLKPNTYLEEGNIAYVGFANNSGDGLGKYYSDIGKKAKEKDIVIVDLRHNPTIMLNSFIEGLCGGRPWAPQAAYSRKTMLTDWNMEEGTERTIRASTVKNGTIVSVPNTVIILTDGETGINAELYAQNLRMLENAFTVGTSTKGMLSAGPVSWGRAPDYKKYDLLKYTLPKTGIPFTFNNSYMTFAGYGSRMGLGFKPDFYVEDPSKALHTVMKLLVNCNLTDIETAEKILAKSGEIN